MSWLGVLFSNVVLTMAICVCCFYFLVSSISSVEPVAIRKSLTICSELVLMPYGF